MCKYDCKYMHKVLEVLWYEVPSYGGFLREVHKYMVNRTPGRSIGEQRSVQRGD